MLASSTLTYAISQTMVIPALPQIRADFGSDASSTAWVMSGFFISSAVSTGIVGRLADMFGKRRMLMVAMATYGAGAFLSALSPVLVALVLARVLMGFGAGVVPVAYAIARDEVPGARVSQAIGSIAMMIGLGAGIGMVLGGVIVDRANWHLSFVVAATLALVVVGLVAAVIPESPVRSPARVDMVGAAGLALGLGGILVAVTRAATWGWTDPRILGLGLAGSSVLVLFVRHEARVADPLLHIPTLRLRPVLLTNIASFGMGAGQVAVSILVVQLAQLPTANGGLGSSAAASGLLLLPYSVTMVIGAQVAGRVAMRIGGRTVMMIGGALSSLGLVGLAVVPVSLVSLGALSGLSGFGISMTLVAAPYILARVVARERTGEANGTNTIARAVGQGFGTQVTATVIAASAVAAGAAALPTVAGYSRAFWLSALACGLAVVGGAAIRRRGTPDPQMRVQVPSA